MSLHDRYEPRRRSIFSKLVEKELGMVFFLGTIAALIGVIYLLSFLGD
jgi:hypothetical protein